MTTAAAPAPETAAGGTGSADDIDPVDALDINAIDESVDQSAIPDEMLIGGRRETADDETDPDRGDGRTPKGQFAKKGKDGDAAPDATAQDPKDPANPDASAAKPSPWRYRALGATHDLEGSVLNEDGSVTIAADKVSALREAFNAKHVIASDSQLADRARGQVQQLQARIQELEQHTTVESARAKAITDSLTRVLQEPDDARAIDAFFALRSSYPQALAKVETEYWKQQATQATSRATAQPSARADAGVPDRSDATQRQPAGLPAREIAADTTREHIEQIKLDHTLRDVTAADWKQIGERLDRTPYAFLRPATAAEAQQYGVPVGDVVFDSDAFHADVMEHVSGLRKSRETVASKTKLAAANARRTAPRVDAPPVATGNAAPVKERRSIQSEQDLEEWFDSDEL